MHPVFLAMLLNSLDEFGGNKIFLEQFYLRENLSESPFVALTLILSGSTSFKFSRSQLGMVMRSSSSSSSGLAVDKLNRCVGRAAAAGGAGGIAAALVASVSWMIALTMS